jgi:hypothetical protein
MVMSESKGKKEEKYEESLLPLNPDQAQMCELLWVRMLVDYEIQSALE